jgi:hypothetical protein
MNVIWHQYPREKIVRMANAFSVKQGFDKDGGDLRLA